MGVLILDGMEKKDAVVARVQSELEEKGAEYTYFRLRDMNIMPCRNCGGCAFKTPGECVFKDDNPKILQGIVHSDAIIIITQITFGGYNSITKKTLDKWGLLGLPVFVVREGRLQHPSRYTDQDVRGIEQLKITIGAGDGLDDEEKKCFEKLVAANDLLMNGTAQTVIIDRMENKEYFIHQIATSLKAVNRW